MDILCARIEVAATRVKLESVHVVSARALAPLAKLLELAAPLLGAASAGLFLKGRTTQAELAEACQSWRFAYDVVPSRSDAEGRIVRVRGPAVRMEG